MEKWLQDLSKGLPCHFSCVHGIFWSMGIYRFLIVHVLLTISPSLGPTLLPWLRLYCPHSYQLPSTAGSETLLSFLSLFTSLKPVPILFWDMVRLPFGPLQAGFQAALWDKSSLQCSGSLPFHRRPLWASTLAAALQAFPSFSFLFILINTFDSVARPHNYFQSV